MTADRSFLRLQKILVGVLLTMLPFIVGGTVTIIRDHERIMLIRETYISTESVRILIQEINTQNEILKESTLDTKADILEMKQKLDVTNDRIDKILLDNRGVKSKLLSQK